ncbi:hypothetical protein [Kangiella spongicola]|uniref:Uncharacterized protein n=1 Tax=Kangiella spongicola TaxID=796379 RepID=A0A318D0Y0_9GAMM|nr:hypothetical protein [Kangiella spongicola]PXF62641.1 hypothetical protein DL796_09940 [Kangiella spongicola]
MYKSYFIISLMIMLSASKNDAETYQIDLLGNYEPSTVLKELKKRGAECELIKDKINCSISDTKLVDKTMREISLEELPAGATYLGMPGLKNAVIAELESRDIPFKLKIKKNKIWFIVQEEHLNEFREIIDNETYKLRVLENM